MNSSVFIGREDAGRQLAQKLRHLVGEEPVILALPRGGLPIGFEIARVLNAPLDLVLVRKIGLPGHEELAIGAVVDGANPQLVLNEDILDYYPISPDRLEVLKDRQLQEIERRRKLYSGNRPPLDIRGKTVIVVDDGIATGATVRAALQAIRNQQPKKLVLAVPVAPPDTLATLDKVADEIVCLNAPRDFRAVGQYYQSFPQLEDRDVIRILGQANELARGEPGADSRKGALP